ncbi:MAG: hypothetical protein HEP71_16635 [Roseivirga sp.]|nr:hypothetical protein [Roseivirga sp.]
MAKEVYDKKDLELIKFYTDSGFKEAALFWNRNSVFLLANLATFSAAFAYLTGSVEEVNWPLRLGIALFGISLCTIWILVIRAGRQMNHGWTYRAQLLAEEMNHAGLKNALNSAPSDAISQKTPNNDSRDQKGVKSVSSATKLMYWLAGVFAIIWVTISLVGKGGLV